MNKFIFFVVLFLAFAQFSYAKGGFSSSGGGGRGFSSSGSYGGSRSYSPSYSSSRTTTTTRTYSGGNVRSYSGCCGGMGMGYGYSNGLITGMIIGNMMHPMNTVVYTGGGVYSNNAFLYPDGRVVNQQGYLVGNYTNGNFVPVQNGQMVAQPIPSDVQIQQPQPVIIQNDSSQDVETVLIILIIALVLIVFLIPIY